MIKINGKNFEELQNSDIEECIRYNEESFFFEFKEDAVSPNSLAEEISAFANTYGGYILIGVADDKTITGCSNWNEQRIYNVFHDLVSPLPSFDIKKINFPSQDAVYIIRVDEGSEPPYITNKGKIYERISSSSSVIKDSNKLGNLYIKRKSNEQSTKEKIHIKDTNIEINNVFGYLDIGFDLTSRMSSQFKRKFTEINEELLFTTLFPNGTTASLTRSGDSLIFSLMVLSFKSNESLKAIPAHTNDFIEIMNDGSVRLRVLFYNDPKEETDKINYLTASTNIQVFSKLYGEIWGTLLEEGFIYAKKYERLTVNKQFSPYYQLPNKVIRENSELASINEKYAKLTEQHILNSGVDYIITDDRIPKTGFLTVDKQVLDMDGLSFTSQHIVEELFHSRFLHIRYLDAAHPEFKPLE